MPSGQPWTLNSLFKCPWQDAKNTKEDGFCDSSAKIRPHVAQTVRRMDAWRGCAAGKVEPVRVQSGVQRSGGARQGQAVPWCFVFMPCLSVGTTLGNAMLGVTGEGHYPECHLGRQTFM